MQTRTFLSRIKLFPTLLGIAALIVTALFWKQEGLNHEYVMELSVAMIGMIGALLTWGLFSTKNWSLKTASWFMFFFTTGITWGMCGGDWKHPMGPVMIISALALVLVTATPAGRFGSIER